MLYFCCNLCCFYGIACFVVVTVILLCCVYFVVASLLFHVWLYVCVYVPTCVLYRSGKEERPWPISRAKINNHQSINQKRLPTRGTGDLRLYEDNLKARKPY